MPHGVHEPPLPESRKNAFDSDEDKRLALTYLVQNVGEAASRMPLENRGRYPEIEWPRIIGMRHRLVQENVNAETVWDVLGLARFRGQVSNWVETHARFDRPPAAVVPVGRLETQVLAFSTFPSGHSDAFRIEQVNGYRGPSDDGVC